MDKYSLNAFAVAFTQKAFQKKLFTTKFKT